MTVKFNGKWEVVKVIQLLRIEHTPWSIDLATRLTNQLDTTRAYFANQKARILKKAKFDVYHQTS